MDAGTEPAADRPRGDAGPIAGALPWIDWLRFLAAMQVFLYHLQNYTFEPYDKLAPGHKHVAVVLWFAVTHFGSEAVLVFFALSGYLVGGGLIERARAGTFRPAAYAIDRATRLMLPFVPALVISLALQAIRHEPVDVARTLGNLASLQGVLVRVDPYLGVDWSLAYETWFYVLGGALAACLTIARRRGLALALVALSLLVFSAIKIPNLIFLWVLGALFAQVPLRRATWAAIFAGMLLCGTGLFLSNSVFGAYRPGWLQVGPPDDEPLCNLLIAFGMLMIVRNVVEMPGRTALARQIDRLGTRLAAFSYSLYLIHIPVLAVLSSAFPRQQDMTARALLQYVGYVVAVLLAAYGFYWLFERHTDAVRRWLKRRVGVA